MGGGLSRFSSSENGSAPISTTAIPSPVLGEYVRPAGLFVALFPAVLYLWIAIFSNRPLRAEVTHEGVPAIRSEVRRLPPVDEVLMAEPATLEPGRGHDGSHVVPSGAQLPILPAGRPNSTVLQHPAETGATPLSTEAMPPSQALGETPVTEPSFGPIEFDVPADQSAQLTPEQIQGFEQAGWRPLWTPCGGLDWYRIDGQVRAYYLNDQRIEWTGVEATFGAEAALLPMYRHRFGLWEMTALGEFYINQPFDRNILANTAERRSYAANFEVETFEMSQLSMSFRRGNFEFTAGKMVTPFGRVYFPLYTNSRMDAPFIRTEAIRWRETGVLLRYDPQWLIVDVALTNGCDDCDTNSSKALISRVGIEQENWAGGVSIKWQDGIGSEGQKEFNNHVGADLMCRWSIFTLSGEVIYDQYGFRKSGYDPDNIFWGRSIYYRNLNRGRDEPITGVGYYVNLGFCKDRWSGMLNYGEYYPESIGVAQHDIPNRRGIIKLDYALASRLGAYTVVMIENGGYIAQDNRPRLSNVFLTGIQYTF